MSSATDLRAGARSRPRPARYVYGIVRTAGDREFGRIGLEEGGERARVYTIRAGSIAAVVSDHPRRDRVVPVRPNLEGHHRVLREVMATVTVLPVSFGQLASGEGEVVAMLRRHRSAIATELDRIDGRAEMALRVQWDVDDVFDHLVGGDRELVARRERLFAGSQAPSMAEKIELGRMFERHLDRRRDELGERILAGLMDCTIEACVNPPRSEKVAMDASFLIARETEPAFEEAVYRLAEAFPACYLFDYSGPWAPFHFVALDLRPDAA